NNNVHTLVSRLTQENKMNQHTDSLKTKFTLNRRHAPVFARSGHLNHTSSDIGRSRRRTPPENEQLRKLYRKRFAALRSSHLRSIQPSIRAIGRCRNGRSCAIRMRPSGNIHSPRTGRKLKIPPMISKIASGMRTSREDGL